jgi:hypothetical protein
MIQRAIMPMALVLLTALPAAAQSPGPQVTPFFSTLAGGPAFYIECQNDTGGTVSSGSSRWASQMRVDAKAVPEQGGIGPGLTTDVDAGGMWRGIVELRPKWQGHFPPVKFGALLRRTRPIDLTEGRHTFAVACGDAWSDDVAFYWEAGELPR